MWDEQGAEYSVAEPGHGASGRRVRITAVPGLAEKLDRLLRAAGTPDLLAAIDALPEGRLFSLTLRLPATLPLPDGPLAGDTHWRAPGGELVLDAIGEAATYTDVATFRAERAAWCRLIGNTGGLPKGRPKANRHVPKAQTAALASSILPVTGARSAHIVSPPGREGLGEGGQNLGADDTAPLAFFTLPPATESGAPQLRVPRVTLRRAADGAQLICSARRGSETAGESVDRWRQAAAALVARLPPAMPGHVVSIAATPSPEAWQARVRATRAAIGAGHFAKAVLARRLAARLSRPADAGGIARRLAAIHADCHVVVVPHAGGSVVAATPERLALKRGDICVSHALAGTARRHGDAADDARSAAALYASPKERREHALVVGEIAARLAGLCDAVAHAPEPALLRLRHVQHLQTTVSGRLRDGADLLAVAARLHPTPAVLGLPAAAAGAWLAEQGEARDGLYTGVAGWLDAHGDGDAVVILRAAWLRENAAVLWAGAGIMAESDPAAELAETELKLATMLEVLGTAI